MPIPERREAEAEKQKQDIYSTGSKVVKVYIFADILLTSSKEQLASTVLVSSLHEFTANTNSNYL